MNSPSAEDQILFLQRVQRLFAEVEFVATYKYALLLALAELAVEIGDDSGNALDLPMRSIGEKFAELYWRQLAEYGSGQVGTTPAVLQQNHGAQVAIVLHLGSLYTRSAGKLSLAKSLPEWRESIAEVAGTVRGMPLGRLQIMGGRLEPFLYDY